MLQHLRHQLRLHGQIGTGDVRAFPRSGGEIGHSRLSHVEFFFRLHHRSQFFGIGGLVGIDVLLQLFTLLFRFVARLLFGRFIGLLGLLELGLGRLERCRQLFLPFLDFKLQLHAVEATNIADDRPDFVFRQGVLEGRHGGHGEIVIADLVATGTRVLHLTGNRIENVFVLEGAHLRLVREIFGLRIRHRGPIEAFVLASVLAVTMHAVVAVEFVPLLLLFAGAASSHHGPQADQSTYRS